MPYYSYLLLMILSFIKGKKKIKTDFFVWVVTYMLFKCKNILLRESTMTISINNSDHVNTDSVDFQFPESKINKHGSRQHTIENI